MAARKPRQSLLFTWAIIILGVGNTPVPAQREPPTTESFRFQIDPKTPVKELLPSAPKNAASGVLVVDDLAAVPEVHFQEPIIVRVPKTQVMSLKEKETWDKETRRARIETAHQIAKINFLNAKKTDGFLESLRQHRADLSGLPFMMRDACRMKDGERKAFVTEVALIRENFEFVKNRANKKGSEEVDFWHNYGNHQTTQKGPHSVAALMQMMGAKSAAYRFGLVEGLPSFVNTDQTAVMQALTRLAVFSGEKEVRWAATEALKKDNAIAATAVLMQGLRYPWPDIARNAAQAVVDLKRTDLIPELVKLLDEPDPRAPVHGEKGSLVREVVRINHHRNCLLCHAPATTDVIETRQIGEGKNIGEGAESVRVFVTTVASDMVLAAVPTPGEDLRANSVAYYSFSAPDILVRADVTYLRQDFSLLQKVADAHPWPEMQRFDYLVRSRAVSEKEAQAYQAEFARRGDSPYRAAALSALRQLTGQDPGTSAKAWRTALRLASE